MPELPDLLHVLSKLRGSLLGHHVSKDRVREPVVLRFAVHGNLSLLQGRALSEIFRKSHFLVFRFEGLDLAINPMLAGRFRLARPGDRDEASLCFALEFSSNPSANAQASLESFGTPFGSHLGSSSNAGEDPIEMRYLDDKKMGKAYLIATEDWKAIPGMQTGGIDILSAEFTRERFVSLLKRRRDQVRVFLLDKKALDSLGNAYADEVLFAAGLHPKTFCRSLSHEDGVRLHDAIVSVMTAAALEVAKRDLGPEVKVRDFLSVRRKEVCPSCGSKIRKAGVRGMDAYFCPKCQPATRAGLVDWTRTGK